MPNTNESTLIADIDINFYPLKTTDKFTPLTDEQLSEIDSHTKDLEKECKVDIVRRKLIDEIYRLKIENNMLKLTVDNLKNGSDIITPYT